MPAPNDRQSNSLLTNFISFTTALVTVVGIYGIYLYYIFPHLSSLKHLPGPARDSWWLGNLEAVGSRNIDMYCGLAEKYGGAVKFSGAFGVSEIAKELEWKLRFFEKSEYLLLTDPVAVKYTLAGGFPRPAFVSAAVKTLIGPGLLASEGKKFLKY